MSSIRLLLSVVVTGLLLIHSNLSAQNSSSVQLAWAASPSSNVTSYVVHYGAASGAYSQSTNVGNQLTAAVTGLQAGQVYYLAVTARDDLGVESLPSNEVNYQVPVVLSPPALALTSPSAGASYTSPASVTLAASVVANGQTINKVQFYNGTTLLGEDVSAPYTFTWSSVTAGSYALTVRAGYATSNTVTSASVNVTVTNPPPTIAPTIVLTSPNAGASYTSPASVALAATVVANGQTIRNVQFYNGTTLLGEAVSAPYTFSWTSVTAGSYALTARAVYATSSTVTSASVNITVTNPPPTIAPTIVLTSPNAGASYTSPASVALAASVVANGQTINKVQFYNGATLLGEDPAAPYTFTWNNVTAGSYVLLARAVYATSTVTSATANVTVTNPPPTITLISPIAGASYTSPATITLAASLTANGHLIGTVQFYNGTTLLGEDSAAPYSLTWSNVANGNHSLTARTVYGLGSAVVSPAVNVTVSGLPPPWQTLDLGVVGLPGMVNHSNEIFTTTGAGKIVGSADSFRFVYQTLSADGDIQAQLNLVSTNGANGSTGLMIRESLTPGSRFTFMGMAQDLRFRWQRRTKTGGAISSTTVGTATPPAVWVRLVRSRSTIYGYKSTNGTTWTKVGNVNLSMATTIHVGFVVASGNTNALITSAFANVLVVP